MNMQILKPSRRPLKAGDIFVYRIKGHDFGFGRVISTDTNIGGGGGTIVIYIYDAFSKHKKEIPKLDKRKLLLPPLGINRLPWSRGYFRDSSICGA